MNIFLLNKIMNEKKILLNGHSVKRIQFENSLKYTKISNFLEFFPKKNLKNSTLTKQKGKIYLDKIKINDCELISSEVFFFFLKPLFDFQNNFKILQKIISRINLIYRHQDFYFSKLKFHEIEKQKNLTGFRLNGFEPKIKNFYFSSNLHNKKIKKNYENMFRFDSGKNFKKDHLLVKKINETNLFSRIKVLTQPIYFENKNEFLDLEVNLNENSSLSYTPEINFYGTNFSSSMLITEKNFLKKMLNLSGKVEIKKNMESADKFFLLLQTEFFNILNPSKKLRIRFLKKNRDEISNKISLIYNKRKNFKTKFDCCYSNNLPFPTYNALENFSLNYSIDANTTQKEILKIKTRMNLLDLMNNKKHFIFMMRMRSFFCPFFLKERIFKYKFTNEIFMGWNGKKSDNISHEYPEFYFLDCRYNKMDKHIKNYNQKSSFVLENAFNQRPFSFCIFSNVFSGKKKKKMFNSRSYGIKIVYKNFLNLYIWKNKRKKKKFQLVF